MQAETDELSRCVRGKGCGGSGGCSGRGQDGGGGAAQKASEAVGDEARSDRVEPSGPPDAAPRWWLQKTRACCTPPTRSAGIPPVSTMECRFRDVSNCKCGSFDSCLPVTGDQ